MGKVAVPSKAMVTKKGLPWYLQVHSWLGCAKVIQLPVEPVLEISLLCWVMNGTVFFYVQAFTLLLLMCPMDTFHTQQLKEPQNSSLHSGG